MQSQIEEYQKPELIRQAIKTIRQKADHQRDIRESEGRAFSNVKSKVKRNLTTQKKARAQSANLAAKRAARMQQGSPKLTATVEADGINQLIQDLNVDREELTNLAPKTDVQLAPERAADFDAMIQQI